MPEKVFTIIRSNEKGVCRNRICGPADLLAQAEYFVIRKSEVEYGGIHLQILRGTDQGR